MGLWRHGLRSWRGGGCGVLDVRRTPAMQLAVTGGEHHITCGVLA